MEGLGEVGSCGGLGEEGLELLDCELELSDVSGVLYFPQFLVLHTFVKMILLFL